MLNLLEERAKLKRMISEKENLRNLNVFQVFLRRHSIDYKLKNIDAFISLQSKIVDLLHVLEDRNHNTNLEKIERLESQLARYESEPIEEKAVTDWIQCTHEGFDTVKHARYCPDCGALLLNFGD